MIWFRVLRTWYMYFSEISVGRSVEVGSSACFAAARKLPPGKVALGTCTGTLNCVEKVTTVLLITIPIKFKNSCFSCA